MQPASAGVSIKPLPILVILEYRLSLVAPGHERVKSFAILHTQRAGHCDEAARKLH